MHGGMLRVRDVDVADSGVYVCHATNGFGTLDVKFLVYVYGTLSSAALVMDNESIC